MQCGRNAPFPVLSDRRLRIRYRHSGRSALRGYTVDP